MNLSDSTNHGKTIKESAMDSETLIAANFGHDEPINPTASGQPAAQPSEEAPATDAAGATRVEAADAPPAANQQHGADAAQTKVAADTTVGTAGASATTPPAPVAPPAPEEGDDNAQEKKKEEVGYTIPIGGLAGLILALAASEDPGPGTSAKHGRTAILSRLELQKPISVNYLIVFIRNSNGGTKTTIPLNELIAGTKLGYRRLNAVGDASGKHGLTLDRDRRNEICLNRENAVRCSKFLSSNRFASNELAEVWPEIKPDQDLLEFINSKIRPS